ncbi:MAG: hypothetical protein AAF709_25290 [Pseudomonadota bacterium]
MSGNILWKFLLTCTIIFWCAMSISPLQDRPFEDYIVAQVTAEQNEFADVLQRAEARVDAGESPTLFIALRDLGLEEGINYAKFFPQINVADVANQNKRNDILLKHILKTAQSQLKLGLDLKGGVGVTLKIDETAIEGLDQFEQADQLEKAITIMGDRLDGMGVAEPVIRARGDNAIEIQLAGLSTKDNPEVIDSIKKPARLEFRAVHPELRPDTTPTNRYPVGYEVLSEEIEDRRSGEVFESRYFVKMIPEATGEIIEDAFASQTPNGGFQINLVMTNDGAKVFRQVTERFAPQGNQPGRPLAIVLDGKLYSAPRIQAVLSKNAQITGSFSQREAE